MTSILESGNADHNDDGNDNMYDDYYNDDFHYYEDIMMITIILMVIKI